MSNPFQSSHTPISQPTVRYRRRPLRYFFGIFFFFAGVGIATYGYWTYRNADGYRIGQEPANAEWYHPEILVIKPLIDHSQRRRWTPLETASALNQAIKWLTMGGVAIGLTGFYLFMTRRQKMVLVPIGESEPMAA